MAVERRAQCVWEGNLVRGRGRVTLDSGLGEIHLDVQGDVPGINAPGFEKYAEEVKEGCPVSQALKNNVEISVTARLD